MKKSNLLQISLTLLLLFSNNGIFAQTSANVFLNGDALPDAPALSGRGNYNVGVRTLEFVNKNQLDILKSKGDAEVFYDRPLKVEVWYPALLKDKEAEMTTYNEVMGSSNDPKRPIIPFTYQGRAARGADALNEKFPLIIVSHGYLGSRLLLSYLTENLASKGYIVVALDHTESTFSDAGGFPSTLLNRSKDVIFMMNQLTIENSKSGFFLKDKIDTDNIGLIGYSMGGYGVLNVAGAGYSDASVKLFGAMSGGSKALETRSFSNPNYDATVDPRIKAVVAFAPWGMERGVWDAESMKGLKTPTFFVAGSQDDISGYEKGIKAIYTGVVNTDRYLLTYINARHNVAPNSPPAVTLQPGLHFDEYYRYAEPAWNERRINNINQHFVTAFLGTHLKKEDHKKYLDLKPNSNEKTWEGFKNRSSAGLELLHEEAMK